MFLSLQGLRTWRAPVVIASEQSSLNRRQTLDQFVAGWRHDHCFDTVLQSPSTPDVPLACCFGILDSSRPTTWHNPKSRNIKRQSPAKL